MGIVILGTTIASAVTSQQIQDLKRQINQLVYKHQALTDQVNRLSQTLKKLDLNYVSQRLEAMNQSLAQNLKTIIGDQQLKLEMINSIDPGRIGVDPKSLLSKILEVINLIGTILLIIQIMCATNPATIAISGILLVINYVFSVITLITNIKTIEELKKQKAELEEYFKKGGEFEQQVNAMADLSFQMMENFYIFVVNFKSLVNELAVNINLLSLSENSTGLNYQYYIDLLKKNPFNQAFENQCLQYYRYFITIQSYDMERRVNMSSKYLDEFERRNNLEAKIKAAGDIAGVFSSTSAIGKALEKASEDVKRLTTLKDRYQPRFQRRLDKTVQYLKSYDQQLLQDMLHTAKTMNEKQLSVVQVVSFFTIKFYADDESGQTLLGYNLKEMFEKTENLSNLGVNSSKQNIIYLPEPEDKAMKSEWNANRTYLENQYRKKIYNAPFQFKKMFIRMQSGSFQLKNQTKSRLNFFYGILVRPNSSPIDQYFEVEASRIFEINSTFSMEEKKMQMDKVERMEETNENLNSLCSFVWFYINGIAYPERVVNMSITKVDNKYKAVVQWKETTLEPEIFGKFLDFSVTDLPLGDEVPVPDQPARVFWKQIMPESNAKVLFKFK